LVSVPVWLLLAVSIIGLVYAVAIGLFLFVGHVLFIAHVRGNGVRLGPEQFPELDEAVRRLSMRLGLKRVPEAYVMQAGGALNALATKFFRSEIVVLFSDLLEACGDDVAARDMIIAHELGHIKCGHLRRWWLIMPAMLVPFLGAALSRAREYTCDRFGMAGAGDRRGALRGLAILAAGAKHGPRVNLEALAAQQASLDTGWMTIGEWLSSHPPLAKRVAALDPSLLPAGARSVRGRARALGMLAAPAILVLGLPIAAAITIPAYMQRFQQAAGLATGASEAGAEPGAPADGAVAAQVERDVARLMDFVDAQWGGTGTWPADADEVYARWAELRPADPAPVDPYDGLPYGFMNLDTHYVVWSSGPDATGGTADDLAWDSRDARTP
ncbi:MAG TPA: M48 family metallopeptidase, partial [Longimicrobiales bacterium]